jgi:hypothetical protein
MVTNGGWMHFSPGKWMQVVQLHVPAASSKDKEPQVALNQFELCENDKSFLPLLRMESDSPVAQPYPIHCITLLG